MTKEVPIKSREVQVIKYRGDDAPELLSDTSQAAGRAAEMVQQLMVFSRQGLQPEHSPVKLQQIAQETVEICRKAFDRKINISIESIGDLGPILGDSGQLSQILMNLCINARDVFAGVVDRPHQIRVEVEEPSHHVRQPLNNPATLGRYVRMRIIDNGTGMDEETRKRVFDPFFTTKEVDEGTGLGLSTVYGIDLPPPMYPHPELGCGCETTHFPRQQSYGRPRAAPVSGVG